MYHLIEKMKGRGGISEIKQEKVKMTYFNPDLEKAACSASAACGHFVGNHVILRIF